MIVIALLSHSRTQTHPGSGDKHNATLLTQFCLEQLETYIHTGQDIVIMYMFYLGLTTLISLTASYIEGLGYQTMPMVSSSDHWLHIPIIHAGEVTLFSLVPTISQSLQESEGLVEKLHEECLKLPWHTTLHEEFVDAVHGCGT